MRIIVDYQNINQKHFRNPYPLPRIFDIIHKLEGFQYATTLDLTMGYYTIELLPKSCNLTTIVTEFGKFRYNRAQMVMCDSGEIFQAKLDKILSDIKGFKINIEYIIIFAKGGLSQHIEQLRVIVYRLRGPGLQSNAPKCSFGLKFIPYLY